MKQKLLFLLMLFTIVLKSMSQENRTFLYASVKDKVAPISNAHIVNSTTNQGTFTNENGEFRILAKENDILKISFVGYETSIITVKLEHFGLHSIVFELLKTNYELDEVHIKKHNLLGFLTTDSKQVTVKKEVNAKTLNLPYAGSKIMSPAERKLHTAMGARNIFSVDHIINRVSGRIKKLQKLQKIETLEKKIATIKNTYSLHIVNEFNIKESDVYKFIYYCAADKNFNDVYNSSQINIIRFLKNKAETFKKLNPKNYN